MESTNNKAGNVAPLASRKRNNTCQEVGSSSKRATLELFPTLVDQNEQSVSQSPANVGEIWPAPHISRHSDFNQQSLPREDLFERLFKYQYEQTRETCNRYLSTKYNDILRHAEERASMIHKEKEMSMISSFQERLASLNEVINDKNTELDNSKRKNIELEEQVAHFKSQAEIWKANAERAEEMLWNVTVSPRRHGQCCCVDKEDTAQSSFGETS